MKASSSAEEGGYLCLLTPPYGDLARVRLAKGDTDGAREMLQKLEGMADTPLPPVVHRLAAAQAARLRLSLGDLAAAANWADALELDGDEPIGYPFALEYLAKGRILIARQRPGEALALLERLRLETERQGLVVTFIEILILQALAYEAQRDAAQATAALKHALSLGMSGGFVRIFADEGGPMAVLIDRLIVQYPGSDPQLTAYLAKLYQAFGREYGEAAKKLELVTERKTPAGASLSERELEILRCVAEGLSNEEIGRKLFIATGTVKKHLGNIFTRLGVNSRTHALARARELGLI